MEEQNTNESSMPSQEEGKNGGMVGKIIGLVVVVVVIALGVYALTRGGNETEQAKQEASEIENETATEAPEENIEVAAPVAAEAEVQDAAPKATGEIVIVSFTDQGYNPKVVSIKKGDSVLFVNDGSLETWPASAMHPTHTVYPGSDIQKCGTPEEAGIFDACRGLKIGETWVFQFNEIGKWNYHNHLNAKQFGSIEVME